MATVKAGALPASVASAPDRGSRSPARAGGPTADRSVAVARPGRTVRSWPLLVLAAPAAAEVWSGWAGIAQKTGFGRVSLLPGIWPSLHLDTTITLPVGVEAYAAYALRAWLTRETWVSHRTRRFAKWSAICSFLLGMAGQVAYHLLAQAGVARAPWAITTIVSCLPVMVLAMGTTLAHMLRADADTAADAPDNGTRGPATSWSPAWPAEDQAGPAQDQAACQAPPTASGPPSRDQNGPTGGPQHGRGDQSTKSAGDRPGAPGRQQACRSGKAGIPACPTWRGSQGFQPCPERPGVPDQCRAGRHSGTPA